MCCLVGSLIRKNRRGKKKFVQYFHIFHIFSINVNSNCLPWKMGSQVFFSFRIYPTCFKWCLESSQHLRTSIFLGIFPMAIVSGQIPPPKIYPKLIQGCCNANLFANDGVHILRLSATSLPKATTKVHLTQQAFRFQNWLFCPCPLQCYQVRIIFKANKFRI